MGCSSLLIKELVPNKNQLLQSLNYLKLEKTLFYVFISILYIIHTIFKLNVFDFCQLFLFLIWFDSTKNPKNRFPTTFAKGCESNEEIANQLTIEF